MSIPNYFDWSDELSVGIQEIDEQHKRLVDLVNQLNVAFVTGADSKVVSEALDRLIQYTQIHFTVEESLMRILGYPDYETHKKHHDALVHQVLGFKLQFADGKLSRLELMEFLHKWLTMHIMKEDTLYTDHFLARGAQRRWLKPGWLKKFWD